MSSSVGLNSSLEGEATQVIHDSATTTSLLPLLMKSSSMHHYYYPLLVASLVSSSLSANPEPGRKTAGKDLYSVA